jgi:hypothetical protein
LALLAFLGFLPPLAAAFLVAAVLEVGDDKPAEALGLDGLD